SALGSWATEWHVPQEEHVFEQSESLRLAVTAGAQQACGAASSLWLLSHDSGLCRQEEAKRMGQDMASHSVTSNTTGGLVPVLFYSPLVRKRYTQAFSSGRIKAGRNCRSPSALLSC
ncbi:mCG1050499, partial [Mus musculus]